MKNIYCFVVLGTEVYDVTQPLSDFSFVDLPEKPAKYELVFAARDLPPMGYKIYYIEKVANKNLNKLRRNISHGYRYGTIVSVQHFFWIKIAITSVKL